MADILKSYLVSLGYEVDSASYNKFAETIKRAGNAVESHTGLMAGNYTKAGLTIVTTIGAIVAATGKMVESIAMADLGYEKLALRMYMSKEAAKQYSIVLKSMGEDPANIRWIPELHKQYLALMKDVEKMSLPKEFNNMTAQVRDFRFEFTRLKAESIMGLQWIGFHLMNKLVDPLGKAKFSFKSFNDYLIDQMPKITEMIANKFYNLGKIFWNAFEVLKVVGGQAMKLWDQLTPNTKFWVAMGLLGALFTVLGPFGKALVVLTLLIGIASEFWDAMQGKETLIPSDALWNMAAAVNAIVTSMKNAIYLAQAFWYALKGDSASQHREWNIAKAFNEAEIGRREVAITQAKEARRHIEKGDVSGPQELAYKLLYGEKGSKMPTLKDMDVHIAKLEMAKEENRRKALEYKKKIEEGAKTEAEYIGKSAEALNKVEEVKWEPPESVRKSPLKYSDERRKQLTQYMREHEGQRDEQWYRDMRTLPKSVQEAMGFVDKGAGIAPSNLKGLDKYSEIIAEAHKRYPNVREGLIRGVIAKESGGRGRPGPTVNVGRGDEQAQGLMQLLPSSFGGRKIIDDYENVMEGTKYLSELIKKTGTEEGALKIYGGFKTKDPSQYINQIMRYAGQNQAGMANSNNVVNSNNPTINVTVMSPSKEQGQATVDVIDKYLGKFGWNKKTVQQALIPMTGYSGNNGSNTRDIFTQTRDAAASTQQTAAVGSGLYYNP
jgi:hypothetical protein